MGTIAGGTVPLAAHCNVGAAGWKAGGQPLALQSRYVGLIFPLRWQKAGNEHRLYTCKLRGTLGKGLLRPSEWRAGRGNARLDRKNAVPGRGACPPLAGPPPLS